jgi:hypothetical protein
MTQSKVVVEKHGCVFGAAIGKKQGLKLILHRYVFVSHYVVVREGHAIPGRSHRTPLRSTRLSNPQTAPTKAVAASKRSTITGTCGAVGRRSRFAELLTAIAA